MIIKHKLMSEDPINVNDPIVIELQSTQELVVFHALSCMDMDELIEYIKATSTKQWASDTELIKELLFAMHQNSQKFLENSSLVDEVFG